jgi:hypothetical protein
MWGVVLPIPTCVVDASRKHLYIPQLDCMVCHVSYTELF